MRKIALIFLFVLIGSMLLTACGAGGSSDPAAQAVLSYLKAEVALDKDKISTFSCAKWEESARMEVDSFQAVTPTLKDATCKQSGTDGSTALVTCQGQIIATYGKEQTTFDLNARTFEVVQEGGDWRVCGYR
jgi:uncharacterized protein YdeI (BOF family)